jgi:hypothetical protein
MKKIPKIYVNKIEKNIDNNKKMYCSFYDDNKKIIKNNEEIDYFKLQNKINELFRSNDFIYKKKFLIKTNTNELEYTIISKSYDYLLTIEGNKIMIKDIIDIKPL